MGEVLIGIVGPCAAGKTTLVCSLRLYGFSVRHIAQEHSYVKNMWQRISNPDILVFLDVSYPVSIKRRHLNWTFDEYQEQQRRLQHARQHANLYIVTDEYTIDQVLSLVLEMLRKAIKF